VTGSGGIDGHRLLGEDVFARFDRGAEVEGAETGRGRENDDVDPGIEDALVAVETDELALFRHIDLVFHLRVLRDLGESTVDFVLEDIGDRMKGDVVVGREGLHDGSGAASTRANEADFQLLGGVDACTPGSPEEGTGRGGGAGGRCGGNGGGPTLARAFSWRSWSKNGSRGPDLRCR
jgi:hypothetical protein